MAYAGICLVCDQHDTKSRSLFRRFLWKSHGRLFMDRVFSVTVGRRQLAQNLY